MVFKRQPRRSNHEIADRVLEKIQAQSAHQKEATEAFAMGQEAEANEDIDGAITAYLQSADAWGRHFAETQHTVPPDTFHRLAILFRKAKAPDMEVKVLEAYMGMAGREPDGRLAERLQRAYELAGFDDEDDF